MRCGPGWSTSVASASACRRCTFVTRARTVSPGSPRRTKTTKPFSRATPFPPYASESIVSSSSWSRWTGAATASGYVAAALERAAERGDLDGVRGRERGRGGARRPLRVPVDEGFRQAAGEIPVDVGKQPLDDRLDDEQPAEHDHDRAHLVREHEADADAERRPQGREDECRPEDGPRVRRVELEAAGREPDRRDRDRECGRDRPDRGAEDRRRDRLRSHDTLAYRRDEICLRDRPVPVLARRGEQPEDEREQSDEPERAEVVPRGVGGREILVECRGMHVAEERHDREQSEHEGERGARRPRLQQLGPDERDHETASRVNSRKTSSSVDDSAVSSCSTMPLAAATSPTRSGEDVRATKRSSATAAVSIPSAASASRSRAACGLRTRTPAVARACTSASDSCATSRPRLMITTESTVCAISARTWLETNTVPPRVAYARRKSRSQRMPCGSRPFAGSSRSSTSGSPRRACASASRWRIPSE